MSVFSARVQPVLVEFTLFNIPESDLDQLPGRVEEAVSDLVGRERLPSDENVREFLRENSDTAAEGGDENSIEPARVRIMLPHDVAVDIAMDRSFNTEQPPSESPLTTAGLRVLTRRSVKTRLRILRRAFATEEVSSPTDPSTCVVCLERVVYNATKITLECEHCFHRGCIVAWLAKLPRQCPSCRFGVDLSPRCDEEHLVRPRTRRSAEQEEDTVVL